MKSDCEEEASNTDRQDAGLTMWRFDGRQHVKEEEIFIESEFDSCTASNDTALVDNHDAGVSFEPLNPELVVVDVKEEHDFDEEPAIKNELSSADEDGVSFEPLNPELVVVDVKEEHDFDEEPAIKNELSSADGRAERLGRNEQAQSQFLAIAERQVACMEMFANALTRLVSQQEETNTLLKYLIEKGNSPHN